MLQCFYYSSKPVIKGKAYNHSKHGKQVCVLDRIPTEDGLICKLHGYKAKNFTSFLRLVSRNSGEFFKSVSQISKKGGGVLVVKIVASTYVQFTSSSIMYKCLHSTCVQQRLRKLKLQEIVIQSSM